jgi:phytoene desaturase
MTAASTQAVPRRRGRVVVVGAGVGGLAAAARLAAQGWSVTVFEQAEMVGGKLGLYERDGFRFDTGPSIVTMPQVFEKLFADTGEPLSSVLKLRRLDPIARYRFADGTWLDAAASDAEFLDNVEALRAGNRAEMKTFLRRSAAIWDATHQTYLERELTGKDLLVQSRRVRDLITIAPWQTMRSLAKHKLSDPRLVSFVDRYATYTGSDPRQAPAALASIPHVERAFGGWYVEGGLRELATALENRCRSLGVTIETSADVTQILVTDGRATGVVVNGENVGADIVVANADARHLYADLLQGGSFRTADSSKTSAGRDRPDPTSAAAHRALQRVQRPQPSLSGFVLCLAVRGETPNLAHHTVLFPDRYDDEFDDLFGALPRAVRNPTIYASVPRDPQVAPPGHEAWFVLVNAPRHTPGDSSAGIDWNSPGLADTYADRILNLMAERDLDIRDRVLWRELRTPADLENRTRAVGGSIYGTSSNGARAAFLRPANRSPFAGLYLVGGSSHPGGGLPLVTLSAQIVAEMIGDAPA